MTATRPVRRPVVAVTRAAEDAGALRAALHQAGCDALVAPLTRTAWLDPGPLQAAMAELPPGAWIAFTSPRAVRATSAAATSAGIPGAWWRARQVACVGEATRMEVALLGHDTALVAADADARGLAEALLRTGVTTPVLFPRAREGREVLTARLRAAGVTVIDVPCYETLADPDGGATLARALRERQVDVVTLAAGSAARAIATMVPRDLWGRARYVSIGAATTEAASAAGLAIDAEAGQHAMHALAVAAAQVARQRPSHDGPDVTQIPPRTSLRLGTRTSALAMRQTELVAQALAAHGVGSEVVTFTTIGDRRLDISVPEIGGKGVFTAELEASLLAGGVDVCVHSLKDLPTENPEGLALAAVLPREDPRDALVLPAGTDVAREPATVREALAVLPYGARVGTSSLRRQAMLRHHRPDLHVVPIRGNVQTRLRKLDEGQADAILLASAGLLRLGLTDRLSLWLPSTEWLPAPGQGVIAIQARVADEAVLPSLQALHDAEAWAAAEAERSFLHALEGGCHAPVSAYARRAGEGWLLTGCVLDIDGGAPISGEEAMDLADPTGAGTRLAGRLAAAGGTELLARARVATGGA